MGKRRETAESAELAALFDPAFYLAQNPDVAAAGVDPLRHYLMHGAAESRDPNPFFSTSYYLETNPDVATAGLNPLVHYLTNGAGEGRNPGPLFDTNHYLAAHPEVAASGMNPLAHYLSVGIKGDRDPRRKARIEAASGGSWRAHLDAPSAPARVKLGEPLLVSGWCFDPTRTITGVEVRWPEGTRAAAFPLPRADVARAHGNAANSHACGFEARIHFGAPGSPPIAVEARFEDGTIVALGPVPSVEVIDDRYCEPLLQRCPTPRSFGVLFLDGVGPGFPSRRYRIDNVREALRLVGIRTGATDAVELFFNPSLLQTWDLLVLFRAGWDHRLEAIVEQARAWGLPVVFDVDDYVFEAGIATVEFIDGIRGWPPDQVRQYLDGVRAYRRTLVECGWFTGSTDYLVERARELGARPASGVIRNTSSPRFLDVARPLRARPAPPASDAVEIAYLSGTKTHQRDLGSIVPALAEVLRSRPRVRLRVVGHVDLDEYEELLPFRERIDTDDFVPWDELPGLLARTDITIAPLELGNPFCEAKSELKWFEGGACGLVTVASATDPFRRAVVDGETGFLCRTVAEWTERLLFLVDHPEERRRVARQAAFHSLNRYGQVELAREASRAYRDILLESRRERGRDDGALVVDWLSVDAFAGSGGHNDTFLAANEMVKRGHQVTVYFPDGPGVRASAIRKFIRRAFGYEPLFRIGLGFENAMHSDALIATHHATAHAVHAMRDRTALPAYFVQDYEPFFSPVGTEYFSAEQTYRYDLFCVTLGPWLKGLLEERFGARARSISFWVDRRYYFPPAERPFARLRPRVVYFARPHMPRRCYDLGIEALRELSRRMAGVQIQLFGAEHLPGDLGFPHQALGVLTPTELGNLYREADLGLAFSTTNPSLATFEMMACGLPVVDLDVMESRERHGDYPAWLAEPSPPAIADAVAHLLADDRLRQELSNRSVEFTRRLPSALDALGEVSLIIEEQVGARVG